MHGGDAEAWAQLLSHLPAEKLVEVIQKVALSLPGLKEAVLDAWLVEDYEAEVSAFLEESRLAAKQEQEPAVVLQPPNADPLLQGSSAFADTSPGLKKRSEHQASKALRKRTLIIAYFPRSSTEAELAAVLEPCGPVRLVRIARGDSGQSRCFAFVEFASQEGAEAALEACTSGRVILDDEYGKTWHLQASIAKHATATPFPRRSRMSQDPQNPPSLKPQPIGAAPRRPKPLQLQ